MSGVMGRWLMGALLPVLFASAALAQEPRVPYVPTPQDVVDKMLQMAQVGAGDYLIDLGSGDGRIVVTAARKHGARGFGVDINPTRIAEATANAEKAGVSDKVAFYQRDLFQTDLSQATVISMYLLPRVNLELRPKLLALRPGTRIVSHDFSMDDWKPDAYARVTTRSEKYSGTGGESELYFWVVPAQSGGRVALGIACRLQRRQAAGVYAISLAANVSGGQSGSVQAGGRSGAAAEREDCWGMH